MAKLGTILLAVGCLGMPALAGDTPRCPGGRFIVQGAKLIPGEDLGSPDEVVLSDPFASIASGCTLVTAKFTATRGGTTVRAVWPGCRDPYRRVQLKANIDPTCKVMTGTLSGRKPKLRRQFVATVEPADAGTTPPSTKVPQSRGGASLVGQALPPDPPSPDAALQGGGGDIDAGPQSGTRRGRSGEGLSREDGGHSAVGVEFAGSNRPAASSDRPSRDKGVPADGGGVHPPARDVSLDPSSGFSADVAPVPCFAKQASVASGQGSLKVTFEGGKLTAEVSGVPLARVLAEVTRLTGAEVEGLGDEGNDTISASFAGLSFQEAIGRLLRSRSFVLLTSGAGTRLRLVRITILPDAASRCAAAWGAPEDPS